jgi:hypothetical protein
MGFLSLFSPGPSLLYPLCTSAFFLFMFFVFFLWGRGVKVVNYSSCNSDGARKKDNAQRRKLGHQFPLQSRMRCMSVRFAPTNRKYSTFFSCKNIVDANGRLYNSSNVPIAWSVYSLVTFLSRGCFLF